MDTIDIFPPPSYDLEDKPTYNMKKIQFNDGYTQRNEGSVNPVIGGFSVRWKLLERQRAIELRDWIDAHHGVRPFRWTHPVTRRVHVVVVETPPTLVYLSATTASVSAQFTEVFG